MLNVCKPETTKVCGINQEIIALLTSVYVCWFPESLAKTEIGLRRKMSRKIFPSFSLSRAYALSAYGVRTEDNMRTPALGSIAILIFLMPESSTMEVVNIRNILCCN